MEVGLPVCEPGVLRVPRPKQKVHFLNFTVQIPGTERLGSDKCEGRGCMCLREKHSYVVLVLPFLWCCMFICLRRQTVRLCCVQTSIHLYPLCHTSTDSLPPPPQHTTHRIGRGGGQHPVDQANKGRYLVWKIEGKPINIDDVCLALILVTYFRVSLCVAWLKQLYFWKIVINLCFDTVKESQQPRSITRGGRTKEEGK